MLTVTAENLLDWTGGGWQHVTVHRTPLTHREAMLRCKEEQEQGTIRLGAYDAASFAALGKRLGALFGVTSWIAHPVMRAVVEPGAVFLVPLNGVLMGELPCGPGDLTCLLYECDGEGVTIGPDRAGKGGAR